eukprot:841399-Amorphochlora_amoeboformis.AAC.1
MARAGRAGIIPLPASRISLHRQLFHHPFAEIFSFPDGEARVVLVRDLKEIRPPKGFRMKEAIRMYMGKRVLVYWVG